MEDHVDELRAVFWRDGVVVLRALFDDSWMALVAAGIERNLRNPGPNCQEHYAATSRAFLDDYCNYYAVPEYRMLVEWSPLAGCTASVLGTDRLWLFYDQIFVKAAPESEARRTPWHQDTTYWVTGGEMLAGAWITVDATRREESLEFVRGSHRGPTFAGTVFDDHDETIPYAHPDDGFARIPDIEADRAAFDIVSFATEPGDVILFHPGVLHGGGATPESAPRRTLSLRFFGDDVTYDPPRRPAPRYPGLDAVLEVGEPLRGPWFPQVFPHHPDGAVGLGSAREPAR